MFWRKREQAAEPFQGSAFDAALQWCQEEGEQITLLNANAFDIQLGSHVVHVERMYDDIFLHAHAILPESFFPLGETVESRVKAYELFAERQFENLDVIMDLLTDGRISIRFMKLMQFQGSVHWMVFNMLSTFDYLLNKDETRKVPGETIYFYVNGKRFINASEALIYYFKRVRKSWVVDDQEGYIAFDAGGMACIVDLATLDNEFTMRFAFSDFLNSYPTSERIRLNAHLIAAAYRKTRTKTGSYVLPTGVSEFSISGVLTQGSEAKPIFTRTLAELTQVVLDSMERLKMNPGLVNGSQILSSEAESLQQAAFFHGDLTGGVERLEE